MTTEEAIKWFEARLKNGVPMPAARSAFQAAIDALKEQDTNKWIPCSERLPETEVEGVIEIMGNGQQEIVDSTFETSNPVLVTIKTDGEYKIAVAQWEVDGPKRKYWIYDDGSFAEGVTAWMPLPEPYRTEDAK